MSASCGLWRTKRGCLLAAIVDLDGLLLGTEPVPDDEEDRCDWFAPVQWHYGPFLEIVLTEHLARYDSLGRLALLLGYRVWIAPANIVTPMSRAAWYRPTPRQLAAMLARMPRVARLRLALRHLPPDPGPDQLSFTFPPPKPRYPFSILTKGS